MIFISASSISQPVASQDDKLQGIDSRCLVVAMSIFLFLKICLFDRQDGFLNSKLVNVISLQLLRWINFKISKWKGETFVRLLCSF